MYYLGSHKGSPEDSYTHSSTNFEKFKKEFAPKGVRRKILAYGTHKEMLALERKLLVKRMSNDLKWKSYYNINPHNSCKKRHVNLQNFNVLSDNDMLQLEFGILKTRNAERNLLILYLTRYAGLRYGEISHLVWQNILNHDLKISENITIVESSPRVIPMHPKIKIALSDYIKKLSSHRAFKFRDYRVDINSNVISTERSKKMSTQALTNSMTEIYIETNILKHTPFSGRKTFVTNTLMHCILNNGNIDDVTYITGLSNKANLMDYLSSSNSDLSHQDIINAI
jgi:integrase